MWNGSGEKRQKPPAPFGNKGRSGIFLCVFRGTTLFYCISGKKPLPSNTLGDPITEVIRRRLQACAFPADAPERNAEPLQAGKLTAPADTGTSLSDTITNGQQSPSSHVVSVYHKSFKKARGYVKINGKIYAPGDCREHGVTSRNRRPPTSISDRKTAVPTRFDIFRKNPHGSV